MIKDRNKLDYEDFSLDSDLTGNEMKKQLVKFYNLLVYWTTQHSDWDTQKKKWEAILSVGMDKARHKKALEISKLALNVKEKDAVLKNLWSESINGLTLENINDKVLEASTNESESRHKMNLASSGVDVCRTCISWNKIEIERMS